MQFFTRDWLRRNGVSAAAAVFSGAESDRCGESLDGLRTGTIQALCVVDMFNEGARYSGGGPRHLPSTTESKVIFLQQLGRGLRSAERKSRLLVIDFVAIIVFLRNDLFTYCH